MTTEEARSVYAGTRLTETLFAKLEELADETGQSKSEIISKSLEEYIKQRNAGKEVK